MYYRTTTDLPNIPAGELLVRDDSNPGNPVYRGATNTNFWISAPFVEALATPDEEVPQAVVAPKLAIAPTLKADLRAEEVLKIDKLESEIALAIAAKEEILTVDVIDAQPVGEIV